MTLNLTQKERMILEDQKTHEEICIQKYKSFANQTNDPELKQLFNSYAQAEQTHYDTINQMLNGQMPNINQGSQQSGQQGQGQQQQYQGLQGGMTSSLPAYEQAVLNSQNEMILCTDALMTEKYVSGGYNTAIFEMTNGNVRQILNHIQKEEQQHGEGIYNYMNKKGMYSPK